MDWERTLVILEEIHTKDKVTQRQLSKLTGLSLGTINGLIQEMITIGLLSATYQNARMVKYEVTKAGQIEKSKLNYEFTIKSFKQLAKIRKQFKEKIDKAIHRGITKFYIMGNHDEMLKLTKMCIIEAKRQSDINYDIIGEDIKTIENGEAYLIWENCHEKTLKDRQMDYVNLLQEN